LELIQSNDNNLIFKGLVAIRKILSLEDTNYQQITQKGFIFYANKFLSYNLYEFQYEALTCIKKLCTLHPNNINSFVNKGGLANINKLIDSTIQDIQELVLIMKLKTFRLL